MVSLMTQPQFKHIYGPVYSWRLGFSLGIDPLTTGKKYCSFNCSYCQLGRTENLCHERRVFVSTSAIVNEVKALPADCHIDCITLSGNGEPTLAINLGDIIQALKKIRSEKIAVITNSSTVMQPDVRADLRLADLILFKVEAPNQELFEKINQAPAGLKLSDILEGIRLLKKTYKGKLVVQTMLTDDNKGQAVELAQLIRTIGPDEVQLNTPLRPNPMRALSEKEMLEIKKPFVELGLNVLSVYEEEKKAYQPFDHAATEKRHGRYRSK
jgi:wyosine [tRNA(Phe)-imidazoG37] synthetase (radical SAM superfamily)